MLHNQANWKGEISMLLLAILIGAFFTGAAVARGFTAIDWCILGPTIIAWATIGYAKWRETHLDRIPQEPDHWGELFFDMLFGPL